MPIFATRSQNRFLKFRIIERTNSSARLYDFSSSVTVQVTEEIKNLFENVLRERLRKSNSTEVRLRFMIRFAGAAGSPLCRGIRILRMQSFKGTRLGVRIGEKVDQRRFTIFHQSSRKSVEFPRTFFEHVVEL